MARFRGTFRPTPTAGVEQKIPTLTPGNAKVAVSAATARSHIETNWQPAAVAMPWTRAMIGCGIWVSATIIRLQLSNSRFCQPPSSAWARISFKSWPAENPRPSAPSTMTRASLLRAQASSAWSAAIIAVDRGLNRSPRLSFRWSTAPRSSRRTNGASVAMAVMGYSGSTQGSFDGRGRLGLLAEDELLDLSSGRLG